MIAQLLNAPNLITLIRLLLTPVIAWAIVAGRNQTALILFAAAAFTDFLDGLLARATRANTRLGQYLDPIADKILLCSVFVALMAAGSVPVWYVAIVFGRDIALVVASAIAMRLTSYRDYTPTIWGKISTVIQIFAAVLAIASSAAAITHAAIWISAAVTLWSAVHYAWRGITFFTRRST